MINKQSKIDKLIVKFCPNGVEFAELGEYASIKRGKRVTKSELGPEKKYPVYSGGVTPMGYFEKFNQPANTLTVVKYGTAGFVNFITEDFWANDVCYCIKPGDKLDNKYLFFVLKSKQNFILSQATNAIPAHLPTEAIESIRIPLPPLVIQEEIVKILNSFTELEVQLEAELEARRKQYEHYRSNLLKFNTNVKFLSLDEVCLSINAGGDLPSRYLKGQQFPSEEFPYPIYSNGSDEKALYGYTNEYRVDKEAVTISARGTIGYHVVRKEKFTPIVRLLTLIPNTKIITVKFLNYVLDITEIGHSGGSIPQLTVPNVKKIKIPVPPLAEQVRIVSIIDQFDALVNDNSIGLPAELSARRQQYEYYRDKLLTFKEYVK